MKKQVIAEVEAIKSSDIYMTLVLLLFEAASPNLNGVRVSENFISEIVMNKSRYEGLGLYCDLDALAEHGNLTHLYDGKADTFGTRMIGSFVDFRIEQSREPIALIGEARIPKRDMDICSELMRLYNAGELKCSFEISTSEYTELEDGTILIDANEKNFLTSMAIVSQPACPSAVAMSLVAELNISTATANEAGVENEEDKTMGLEETVMKRDENLPIEKSEDIVDKLVPHVPDSNPDIAPVETAEETDTAVSEETVAGVGAEENNNSTDETTETAEEETAACKKSEEENAGCCKKSEEETAGCCKKSECDDCEECDDPEECEDAECKKAEQETAELKETIAELQKQIAELKSKIAEHDTAIAEVKTSKINAEALNPFMDSEPQVKKSNIFENPVVTNKWTLFD